MARIRSIKPEFMRHEKLQDLEAENPGAYVMLVFVGLWMQSDSNGVFRWRPRQLKLDILPFLDFKMENTLQILLENGFVRRFESDGEAFGLVNNFRKHQRLNGKEAADGSKFPVPSDISEEEAPEKTCEDTGKQQGSNREAPEKTCEDTGKHPVAQEKEREKEKERNKGKENREKERTRAPILPDWVPLSEWENFISFRQAIKKPMTHQAKKLAITELEKLMADGNDPAKVLNQSTLNGWTGLFPLKNNGRAQPRLPPTRQNSQPPIEEVIS